MWLASISKRLPDGTCHPARDYSKGERSEAYHILNRVLGGVGDKKLMRHFRMCLTQCLHKGLSDAELDRLPEGWKTMPARHIAGAPLEIFWERGVPPDCLSAKPCANPGQHVVDKVKDIYFPIDCGTCESCLARRAILDGPACGESCEVVPTSR